MSNAFPQLPASIFVEILSKSNELDDRSKGIIISKLFAVENNIAKNKNIKAFENWSNFMNKQITKYVLYYHNHDKLIPRFLEKIWSKISNEQKDRWIHQDYTDNYPYMLLLFGYTSSDCDILNQSYKSYMEDRDFYTQFKLVTVKLFMELSVDNEYLLNYIVENIIFYMQRRILTMCKVSKDIRRKIIKMLMIYRENNKENANQYVINILKKLVYYDKYGGLISLNVSFNDNLQIKYIEKVQYDN